MNKVITFKKGSLKSTIEATDTRMIAKYKANGWTQDAEVEHKNVNPIDEILNAAQAQQPKVTSNPEVANEVYQSTARALSNQAPQDDDGLIANENAEPAPTVEPTPETPKDADPAPAPVDAEPTHDVESESEQPKVTSNPEVEGEAPQAPTPTPKPRAPRATPRTTAQRANGGAK